MRQGQNILMLRNSKSRYKDIEEFVVNELNIDFDVIDRIKNKILDSLTFYKSNSKIFSPSNKS